QTTSVHPAMRVPDDHDRIPGVQQVIGFEHRGDRLLDLAKEIARPLCSAVMPAPRQGRALKDLQVRMQQAIDRLHVAPVKGVVRRANDPDVFFRHARPGYAAAADFSFSAAWSTSSMVPFI